MTTTRSMYTRANYDVYQTTMWQMLSDDQCEEIFFTALELLERTGAEVFHKEALDLFDKHGCWVEGNRVRIPSAISQWAVRTAPSRITLCNRNGKRALLLETNNVYFGPGHNNSLIIDPLTGEVRKPLKTDVAATARVCDGLKNIDFAMSNGVPTDINPEVADVHAFEALVTNTTKPILQGAASVEQFEAIVEIAAAVAGGLVELQKNPFVVLYVETNESLVHSEDAMKKVIFAAKNKIPFIYGTNLIAGNTAPATPAGAIVVALANALVGITLAQFVQKGAPVLAGGLFTIEDTENEITPLGAPEISLMCAGMANALHYLGIPSLSFGGSSDSKMSDAQMGLETAFSILHAGMSGANLVHGCGQMEHGLTGSLEQLVMGDEVMGMTRRMMRGIEVNEERLARGVVDVVSPGGHYLGEEHTLKYFRKEFWWPTVINRLRIDDWTANGAKTLGQRVKEKTQNIIKTHQPEQLTEEKMAKVNEIIKKLEAEAN
ncbi:MAG: trimethylamine methyltransferase family protein [Desulfitobacteriaceae bacterium]|nr:trimethylamine methyltransferase family protein [Desulfitobacteriaceae bacterium]